VQARARSPDCRDAVPAAPGESKKETMTKSLIIAEKPSVAQDIVRALTPVAGRFDKHDEYFESERYIVTSAVGHLLEIKAPEEFEVMRG
jgi:DNA topoisomerase-3